jgi:hypothetical protein
MRYVVIAALAVRALQAQAPAIFAPGVISDGASDLSPAFAPDCRAVWYTMSNNTENAIVTSHVDHGRWTRPSIAEFSGHWRDLEAAMAPDGSYLIFASNRPATEGGAPLDGNYGGSVATGRGGNLWRVDRRGNDWSAPVRLPETVNTNSSVFSPSVVADGSVYFMKPTGDAGRFQIFRSPMTGGQYGPAERVSFSDEQYSNVDVAVAPDESYAVFSSNRPPTAAKDLDLFIVFRKNGVWGEPQSLGPTVNSPFSEIEARLSPDGRTLFFGSNRVDRTPPGGTVALDQMRSWNNGLMHIWRTDLSSWLPPADHRGCTLPN